MCIRDSVGSAIVRNLEAKGFTNIITMDRIKLDLTKLHDVQMFFMMEQPEYVFLAAARNTYSGCSTAKNI